MQKRFLFTVVPKSIMLANAFDELLKVFSWSMNVFASGHTPEIDWRARRVPTPPAPLAGGWEGILAQ
eukprot:2438745-Pyramimonas_sp.AAC.1